MTGWGCERCMKVLTQIRVGERSADELRKELVSRGILSNDHAQQMLLHLAVHAQPMDIWFVESMISELWFSQAALITSVLAGALARGACDCSVEMAVLLRLAHDDQLPDEPYSIGMQPMDVDFGYSAIFSCRRHHDRLRLDGGIFDPARHMFGPKERFVFAFSALPNNFLAPR